ncbi:MAG: hypothetical protein WBE26_18885, partial [Phycisphaerae bacterium]
VNGADVMKKMVGLVVAVVLTGSAAWATDLDLSVQNAADGSNYVVVDSGATVNYQIVGLLSDTDNLGLALFGFDLVFDGGDLPQADTPTTGPITSFVKPDGITNPAGFGGTLGVTGEEGNPVQVGGGQNTIKNTTEYADFPTGAVTTHLGQTEIVLVTGSLPAPDDPGTYHLSVANAFANVIRAGETGDNFWATDAVENYTSSALTIQVDGCTIVSTDPPNCAIDARQPSDSDGSNPDGWRQIEVTFNCTTASLPDLDFTARIEPGGTPVPVVATISGTYTVTVALDPTPDTIIETGVWTCFTYHEQERCLGYLPADVNKSKTSDANDVLSVIDCLSGTPCEQWECDADRTDLCAPADMLRVIDLLNGADAYDPWLGQTLPVCPSEGK